MLIPTYTTVIISIVFKQLIFFHKASAASTTDGSPKDSLCPDGWFQLDGVNACHKLVSQESGYYLSYLDKESVEEAYCLSDETDYAGYATITNAKMNTELCSRQFHLPSINLTYLIGVIFNDGHWMYLANNKTVPRNMFNTAYETGKDCVIMDRGCAWRPVSCDDMHKAMCEIYNVNACLVNGSCPSNAKRCEVTGIRKRQCFCPDGLNYNQNNNTCDDLDECNDNPVLCQPDVCTNTVGSYKCVCAPDTIKKDGKCVHKPGGVGSWFAPLVAVFLLLIAVMAAFYCYKKRKQDSLKTPSNGVAVNENPDENPAVATNNDNLETYELQEDPERVSEKNKSEGNASDHDVDNGGHGQKGSLPGSGETMMGGSN